MVAEVIWEFMKIKPKARDDTILDQYNRLFMMKLCLFCAAMAFLSWSTDQMHCVVPGFIPDSTEFEDYARTVQISCWIQGLYIFRSLATETDSMAYYGVTKDIDQDGMVEVDGAKALCKTYNKLDGTYNENCEPMEKTFFTQYQYMPFVFGALAMVYYLPYLAHKFASQDIIKLRDATKVQPEKKKMSPEGVRKYFFRNETKIFPRQNGLFIAPYLKAKKFKQSNFLWLRYVFCMGVKVLYITVNVAAFYILDGLLMGGFKNYGIEVYNWTKLNHTEQFDYLGPRENPKPTNTLLPPFGYCDIITTASDIKASQTDKMRFVCELSQHVLYQYIFILLWIVVVVGVAVSAISFVIELVKMITKITGLRAMQERQPNKKLFKKLTYREMEYLDYLEQHDKTIYGEVIELLDKERVKSEQRNTRHMA